MNQSLHLRNRPISAISLLGAFVVVLFSLVVRPAGAAGIVVNSAADTVANDGACTLREAITAANTNTASGAAAGECAAGSGPDTITFAANYTITLVGSQLPEVTTELTITGNGAANTIFQADAAPGTAAYRVFEVASTGNLTLDGVTVRHGICDLMVTCGPIGRFGGGILNSGSLWVNDSTLSGNSATAGGGIFSASATLTVTNSIVSDNSASFGSGGGIYSADGTLNVSNSTLFGNWSSFDGGGIYNFNGPLTLTHSTLSDNSALDFGGSIYNRDGTLAMTNSTLSGNSAEEGGGIYSEDSTTTVTNSTFSGNSANLGGGLANTVNSTTTLARNLVSGNSATVNGDEVWSNSGTVSAGASNVFGHIGQTSAQAFFGFAPGASDVNATSDSSAIALTAILDATLSDNGGPTLTHALVEGSPAIDRGPTAACAAAPINDVDQRGRPRNINILGTGNDTGTSLCDSGALEFQLPIGTIQIIKVSNPANDRVFNFADDIESPNSFTLQDPSNDTKTFSEVSTSGSYFVTELDAPGWPLTALTCNIDLASTVSTSLAGGLAVVNTLDDGDTVTCTFTSTQCQPGNYDDGGNTCVDAEAGHYVPTAEATESTPCSPGSYQPDTGQDSCLLADPGFYVDVSGSDKQFACPPGTTSGPGATVCTPTGGIYFPMVLVP